MLAVVGCEPKHENDLEKAQQFALEKEFRSAFHYFQRVLRSDKAPNKTRAEAALAAARIAHLELKNFARAAEFYRAFLILSDQHEKFVEVQWALIEVLFDQMGAFPQAALELQNLLSVEIPNDMRSNAQIKLVRCYIQMNDLNQAQLEAQQALDIEKQRDFRVELKLLLANIASTQKRFQDAEKLLTQVLTRDPELARNKQVPITLSVTLEEMGEYRRAVQLLSEERKHHPTPEFIDLRIQRIEERMSNAPGARGLRK